jgi:antibiotic biosynthesis monooxygenase (ABM) superfamily enzyme
VSSTSETPRSENNEKAAAVDRERQWAMPLAIATSAFLVVMTLSGLSIWLLPFGVTNQVLVFVHTLVGVLFFVPCLWYLVRHWLAYRSYMLTFIKWVG